MTEVKFYKCDFCGATYATYEEAEKCEKYHVKPLKIADAKYLKGYSCPKTITIQMDNGKYYDYE